MRAVDIYVEDVENQIKKRLSTTYYCHRAIIA
jgi:hypothetical protein